MEKGATSSNNVVVPPLNLLLILKEESGEDLFSLSMENLRNRLCAGVTLRDKKENTEAQFFWMDEKSNLNCFMLLPKSLRISAEGGKVPGFISETEKRCTRDITLTRVKYERVGYLRVAGKFGTMGLSAGGTKYEVVLSLKLLQTGAITSSIYAASAKRLSLPDGSQNQQTWEMVEQISPGIWHQFHVGTFLMTPNNVGELSFDLQVYFWGRPDILIKGVAIKPPSAKC